MNGPIRRTDICTVYVNADRRTVTKSVTHAMNIADARRQRIRRAGVEPFCRAVFRATPSPPIR